MILMACLMISSLLSLPASFMNITPSKEPAQVFGTPGPKA
jgi:hypothetical protein